MRRARVLLHNRLAGELSEITPGRQYRFDYAPGYDGPPVSLTMPVARGSWEFDSFPPFFDGLLPEGVMLEALLREHKVDRGDSFAQLLVAGADTVGAVTVEPVPGEPAGGR